jgi:sialic acid synthase SpsE
MGMTPAPIVQVGGIAVGGPHPPLFLADIGTFFNQDIDCALRLVDGIADAGLAFVKGEVLHDAGICLDAGLEETIVSRDLGVSREDYRSVILRKVVALADYARIFEHARARGLRLALSVYDDVGLDFAIDQGAALLKIASSNIVHQPLIARAAASGLPVAIDTGRATMDEIARAIGWFREAGGESAILQHSPPAPPASAALHDLETIGLLQRLFDCPAGLSDHHAGDEMLYAAIALGAHVVEKGVCPDGLQKEQDVAHALAVGELGAVSPKGAAQIRIRRAWA